MFSTTAHADLAEPILPQSSDAVGTDDLADDDPMAPARGILLGMALGLVNIAIIGLMVYWLA